jgi:hypothetical protein
MTIEESTNTSCDNSDFSSCKTESDFRSNTSSGSTNTSCDNSDLSSCKTESDFRSNTSSGGDASPEERLHRWAERRANKKKKGFEKMQMKKQISPTVSNIEELLQQKMLPISSPEFIGKGSFAKVYKCAWTKESHGCEANSLVAVKMVNVDIRLSKVNVDGSASPPKWLKREVETSRIQNHQNLVQVIESFIDSPPYLIVLEYCCGGSLYEVVFSGDPQTTLDRFGWHHRLKAALDIAAGMQQLHEQLIVHRDLKPQNVLLVRPVVAACDEVHAKVCDFGLARYLPKEDCQTPLTQQVGSYHYMAPELFFIAFNADCAYNCMVDVYSYGILLFQMLAGNLKYPDEGSMTIADFVLFASKGGRPSEDAIPVTAPEMLRILMKECWQTEPSSRPAFSEIAQTLKEGRSEDFQRKDIALGRFACCQCCSSRNACQL